MADMTNKWSEEVVARKKFEDNLMMKTRIADRLDQELEVNNRLLCNMVLNFFRRFDQSTSNCRATILHCRC